MSKMLEKEVTPQDSAISFGFNSSEQSEYEYLGNDYQIMLDGFFVESLEEDQCVNESRSVTVSLIVVTQNEQFSEINRSASEENVELTDFSNNTLDIHTSTKLGIYDFYEYGLSDEDSVIDVSKYSKATFSIFRNESKDKITVVFLLE